MILAGKRFHALNIHSHDQPTPEAVQMLCRRDNVTADAAGRIGVFPLDLAELLHDLADSG
jgi:hypothetical protein